MENESELDIEKVSDEIEVEKYEIDLRLTEEDQERFEENPYEIIKELLERQDFDIRKLLLSRRFREDPLRSDPHPGCYHIVYPEEERSLWWCD